SALAICGTGLWGGGWGGTCGVPVPHPRGGRPRAVSPARRGRQRNSACPRPRSTPRSDHWASTSIASRGFSQPKEGSHVGFVADRSHPEVVRRHGRRELFQIAPGG